MQPSDPKSPGASASSSARGLTVLHISADYPDPVAARKTRAISNLLELVPEHTHSVYSVNRIGWGAGISGRTFGDRAGEAHRAVTYGAPPMGIFLQHHLCRLADWILDDVARLGLRPDLIHAHKLSVEGLVAARVARQIGAPLAVSIQGNSDLKIITARPDLRPVWRRIWHEAAVVFPFAPWSAGRLAELLGARSGPTRLLPCPGPGDRIIAPRIVGPVFRSAFHLAGSRGKNADGLIRAVGMAARQTPDIRLEIIGGGDDSAARRLSRIADRAAPGRITLVGAVPHGEMQSRLNASCAFALVSHRESFGMVFSEALLAGCPCLIPAGRGIDGYLAEGGAVISAPPRDIGAIADGLVRLAREEGSFKKRLAQLAESGALDIFRRDSIATTYRMGLAEAAAGDTRIEARCGESGHARIEQEHDPGSDR